MKISDEQLKLLKLYRNAPSGEKIKIYARIIFNFNQIKKYLDRFIPDSGCVFDYGCGYGIFANYIKLKNPNLNIIGFDISQKRIEIANGSAKATGVKFQNVLNLDELNNLKLVLFIDVLLFIPKQDKIKLFNLFYNKLENSGIILIKDTLKSNSIRFKYTKFEEKIKLKLGIYGKDIKAQLHYTKKEEFVEMLKSVGFEIVEIEDENNLIYPGLFIIARK